MAHHDDGTLRFAYLHGEWYALDDYSHWPLKVYNEHEQSCPVSTEEVLAGATDELRELMTLKSNAEYLVAALLARLDVPRTYLEDWLIDEFGFHRSAVGGYLTKNLAYGQLSAKGAEGLGLTRGHQVAHLVSLGYDIDKVLHDYHTMPREQWLREYQV